MINKMMTLGEVILKKVNYYGETKSEAEKIGFLLKSQMIAPISKQKKDNSYIFDRKAIVLNFNMENKTSEFKLSTMECYEKNIEYFKAFTPNTPNGAKIFFCSNTLEKILENVFDNQLLYIAKNKKRTEYLKTLISEDYISFVKELSNAFYNPPAIDAKKNKSTKDIKLDVLKKECIANFDSNYSIVENFNFTFMKKNKLTSTFPKQNVDCNNMFLITFNDQTIDEYENGKYLESYLNLCYYDFITRFYHEDGISKKLCHNCGKQGKISKNSVVPWKFIAPISLCSERLNDKLAYNSFGICEECLIKLLVGINLLKENLSDRLFGLPNYIIPTGIEPQSLEYVDYVKVMRLFESKNNSYQQQINDINERLKKTNRKNLNFDLMFYYHNKQQFDILKLINNVDYKHLARKFMLFDEVSHNYKLDLIPDYNKSGNQSLTFADLRYSLIISKLSSMGKLEFNNYGQKLIILLESFANNKKISLINIIKDFVSIYKKRINIDKEDRLSAFKMVLFITIFNELGILKHGGKMENKEMLTKIQDERLVAFLQNHAIVYNNNPHKQGLFLLGTIISKIKYAQKDKASNILKRLNFESINSRKIHSLVKTIHSFYQIYKKDIFLNESLWGCTSDRLQGIEESKLTSDEITFYILSGISYQDYVGILAGIEKKNNTKQGDQNEDQQ